MTTPMPAEPFILRLPNEILHHIVSYFAVNDRYDDHYDSILGHLGGKSQLLGLLHVCKRFRQIVHESAFWLEESFCIRQLAAVHRYNGTWEDAIRLTNFSHAILSDTHLQQCLQRKTLWTFGTTHDFSLSLQLVPCFTKRAQRISFSLSAYPEALAARFDNVTDLKIVLSKHSQCLDNIAFAFPSLKTFTFSAFGKHRNVHGSIQNFRSLEHLYITQSEPILDVFGPLESRQRLKRLYLDAPSALFSLQGFDNLEHVSLRLRIEGFSSLLDCRGSVLSIASMDARVIIEGDPWKIPTINPFPPRALANLRKLNLSLEMPTLSAFSIEISTWILRAVCGLTTLQQLKIEGPPDAQGAACLRGLENLERLCWIMLDEPFISYVRSANNYELDAIFDAGPTEYLQSTFAGFQRCPTIEVTKRKIVIGNRVSLSEY